MKHETFGKMIKHDVLQISFITLHCSPVTWISSCHLTSVTVGCVDGSRPGPNVVAQCKLARLLFTYVMMM